MSFRCLFEDEPGPSLVDLPQELLNNITNYLSCNADIAALSQTCQDLHCRTANALYQNITLTWRGNVSEGLSHFYEYQPPLSPRVDILLHTLLAKPQYAKSITCIDFRFPHPRQIIQPWAKTAVQATHPQHMVSLALAALTHTNLETTNWITAIKDNLVGAITALLLWHCPNLTELRMGSALLLENEHLGLVLRDKLEASHDGRSKRWQALSSVTIKDQTNGENHPCYRGERGRSREEVMEWVGTLSYLYSPALKSLTMCLGGQFSHSINAIRPALNCISLTTLRLPESSSSPKALADLLSCTPALKCLDYEACMEVDTFNFNQVNDALAHVKDTLEHFRWIFHVLPIGRSIFVRGHGSAQKLTSLTSLRLSLDIFHDRGGTLLGGVLPVNLKELGLISYIFFPRGPNVEQHIEETLQLAKKFVGGEVWRQVTPRLERFYMTNLVEDDWLEWEFRDKLEDFCEENGLKYGFEQVWDDF